MDLDLIITSKEQLEKIIQDAITRAIKFQPLQPEVSDKTDLVGACEYLNHLGYKIPKSTIYKLSYKNEVPCKRIGRRLVFSRKALQGWFENKLESSPRYNAALELSKSAQRKLRKG